ncbi:MAG: bifunctional tetrahydrofolate synthase/dihydrofolate synthase [Rivihabitans pingtungensis]
MSQNLTLADWLTRLEALNINSIDLGLDRVGAVRDAMGLIPPCPVITVAGTNGKGSVCAMLSTILHAAGYRVGTFTSPHLLAYNERVAIDLKPASDAQLAAGFAAVEAGRGDTRLTYFEFSTLAAMHTFISAQVDVIVLEVGLGGRLDATNAFDPSCAVLTSVDLDHQDWLGGTREAIGREKAGIFRAATPAICADPRPPRAVIEHAEQIGARLLCLGQDFGFAKQEDSPQWNFWLGGARRSALPIPALRGGYQLANASAALAALETLRDALPVGMGDIRRGLLETVAGRFQVLPGKPVTVLDVAHNPQAARALATSTLSLGFAEQRYAVFGMLSDKDADSVIEVMREHIDTWLLPPLDSPRALSPAALAEKLAAHGARCASVRRREPSRWRLAASLVRRK